MKYLHAVAVLAIAAIMAAVGYLVVSKPHRSQALAPVLPSSSLVVAVSAPPPAPSASMAPKATLELLGEFSTLYKTDTKDARVHNIERGAEKIDESIIEPGEVWSFNKTVGPRTEETGFRKAPVLIMGEVFQDVGGGMCQVSSTMFAASLYAGLETVKRLPHSRPSSYIPRGLDATVNYPEQCWEGKQDPNICFDLQVKNPYPFPVKVTTQTGVWDPDEQKLPKDMRPEGPHRRLTVQLWGKGPKAVVQTQWQSYATPDFKRRWRKGWKPGTWSKKSQSGKPGLRGARVIDILWPDGHRTHDIMISDYKPVDEVWWVGRDWEGGDPW